MPHPVRLLRAPGPLAIIHPFPSILDGMAAAALALVAGGFLPVAIAAGFAMVLVQAAIGITNDVVDRADDSLVKPWKPLPAGSVALPAACVAAVAAAATGLGVALAIRPAVGVVAAAGLVTGLAYDAWLKRTTWSWLPYAVGISLVPAYAWLAARGVLPNDYGAIVLLAVLAGLLVALSNGLVDLVGDTAIGRGGLAARLGRRTSGRLLAATDIAFIGLAGWVLATRIGLTGGGAGRVGLVFATFVVGAAAMLLGLALSASSQEARRERGWELHAVAVALIAVAWLPIVT